MNLPWILKTNGDPLGTIHRFISRLWQELDLQAMLLPPTHQGGPHAISNPDQLGNYDLFQPLMLINLVKVIPAFLDEHPGGLLGAWFRPCELRALNALARRGLIQTDRLFTIAVDCLGTFPEDEFQWRLARKGSGEQLSRESLQFAPQGGIATYRYRVACQVCSAPAAANASVNIGLIGLPLSRVILVETSGDRLDWQPLTDGQADKILVNNRRAALVGLTGRHARTRQNSMKNMASALPADLDSLLAQIESCPDGQVCLDACPICSVSRPSLQNNHYCLSDFAAWHTSCVACGMCAQACPQHKPLDIIFYYINQQANSVF